MDLPSQPLLAILLAVRILRSELRSAGRRVLGGAVRVGTEHNRREPRGPQ